MGRILYRTAGESHGAGVLALVEGLPAGLAVDLDSIHDALRRRRGGYGRGPRQKIEEDRVEVLAGLRRGRTLGSPLALWIVNRDRTIDRRVPRTVPRPGHADLAGLLRIGGTDVHAVAERASARETAGRVAAGAVARLLLREIGVEVAGFVVAIGGIEAPSAPAAIRGILRRASRSDCYGTDPATDRAWRRRIDLARAGGDSVGGIVEVRAEGAPPGLGSCAQWDERLDGRLALAVMSVPAIKGVEIGPAFESAARFGSRVHDGIVLRAGRLRRTGNRAGGIEGGMTNGECVVVRAAMKPLSTLARPLPSVDLATGRPAPATVIRTDTCAVPAASVVCEAVVALVLADAAVERFGAVTVAELRSDADRARRALLRR
ncbi:MAG: chorismate synthase [Planctomycetes bacterium]|nr:chorismate synthase [Planctomycetota bacterium]